MKSTLIYACTLFVATAISSQTSQAAKLYKWVDSEGNISYQDQPPPNNAKVLEEQELQQSVNKKATNSNKAAVLVYTVENCEQCDNTIQFLKQRGVPYRTISMVDRDTQQRLLDNTNSLLAPTIEVNNQFITNSNPSIVERALIKAGYDLDPDEPEELKPELPEYSTETLQ